MNYGLRIEILSMHNLIRRNYNFNVLPNNAYDVTAKITHQQVVASRALYFFLTLIKYDYYVIL
jgi:hypothetical protein